MTRTQYMYKIQEATKLQFGSPEERQAVEEAMACCLVTFALAHRRIHFSAEVVETVANKILALVDEVKP